jgi:hypothetical protein
MKRESGQMTIEAILLMTVILGVALMISSEFREKKYLYKLVGGPWDYIQGMMESGVWAPAKKAQSMHPNFLYRHGTRKDN